MASAIRPVSPASARPCARSRPTRLTETTSYSRCREAASRAHPARPAGSRGGSCGGRAAPGRRDKSPADRQRRTASPQFNTAFRRAGAAALRLTERAKQSLPPPYRERCDANRRSDVLHRLLDGPDRAWPGAGRARLRVAVGAGALAHPAVAQIALSVRRRIAEAVLRRDGPVCDAKRRGGGHEEAQTRHWRLPRHSARHDPDREGGGVARPGLGRAVSVRDRRRLEPGRDGRPRDGLRDALQEDARADRGDARDLDQDEAGVPRRNGRLSADDDLAQTGAEPAARYRRRRLSACRTPRGALRQWLGPDRRARAVWRHRRLPAEVQGDAERGRPQIRGRADHADGRRRGCRSAEALSRHGRRALGRDAAGRRRRCDIAAARPLGANHPPGQRLTPTPSPPLLDFMGGAERAGVRWGMPERFELNPPYPPTPAAWAPPSPP